MSLNFSGCPADATLVVKLFNGKITIQFIDTIFLVLAKLFHVQRCYVTIIKT